MALTVPAGYLSCITQIDDNPRQVTAPKQLLLAPTRAAAVQFRVNASSPYPGIDVIFTIIGASGGAMLGAQQSSSNTSVTVKTTSDGIARVQVFGGPNAAKFELEAATKGGSPVRLAV